MSIGKIELKTVIELSDKIFNYIKEKEGFYIECGANDGITQSNTYKLEKYRNWTGLLVEASPNIFHKCIENRSKNNIFENYALVSDDLQNTIKGDFDGSLMGSINGTRLNRNANIEVKSSTLTSLLKRHSITKVDFFSLDVEGYELDVLKGLDFEYCSPTYLLIEIYEKHKKELFQFLTTKGYDLVCNLSGYNHKDNPHWDGTHNDYLFKKK